MVIVQVRHEAAEIYCIVGFILLKSHDIGLPDFSLFEIRMTVEWLLFVPPALTLKHFALYALPAFAGLYEFQNRQGLFPETA